MPTDNTVGSPTRAQKLAATLQSDAVEAAWRTAGSQLVKLTRDPLSAVLQRHLGPDDDALRAKIGAFLQTEVGTALLAGLLSVGLSALPQTHGEVPARLAKELRIRSMTGLGDALSDVLMGPLREVIGTYLQGMPVVADPPELTEGVPRGVFGAVKTETEVG